MAICLRSNTNCLNWRCPVLLDQNNRTWRHPPEHSLAHYLFSQEPIPQSLISKDATEKRVVRTVACIVQEWTDINCAIISANNFSRQSVVISRISPVQLAGSVRKSSEHPVYFSYTSVSSELYTFLSFSAAYISVIIVNTRSSLQAYGI